MQRTREVAQRLTHRLAHRLIRGSAWMALLMIAACTTAAVYQPLEKGVGYSEQRLETDRFRVVFEGGPAMPRTTVEDYVLYRAAELALANGWDGFTVVTQNTEAISRGGGTRFGVGLGGFGSNTGIGVGVGTGTGGDVAHRASIDARMYRGSRPPGSLQAYDARELKSNLEAKVIRTSAKS